MKAGRKVRLTKSKDTRFDGNHPNSINEGYVKQGVLSWDIKVGSSVEVGSFYTSTVTKINSETEFETLNSVYTIQYLD